MLYYLNTYAVDDLRTAVVVVTVYGLDGCWGIWSLAGNSKKSCNIDSTIVRMVKELLTFC